jgi:hypothetical protein
MALEKDKVGLILLGASTFPNSNKFSSSDAFLQAKKRIKSFFENQLYYNNNSEQILDLFDMDYDPNTIDRKITEFIKTRQNLSDILIYYVGHGAYSANGGFLLTIMQTRDDNMSVSSITSQTLGTTLSKYAKDKRLFLILDCCFAAGMFTNLQSVAEDLIKQELVNHFPENGLALLCASSKDRAAVIVEDRNITMFTEAFDIALRNGTPEIKSEFLTLRQLKDITYSYIKKNNPGEAVMPEVHSPEIPRGDIADLPHFQNFGFKSGVMIAYNIETRKIEIEENIAANNVTTAGKLFLSFVRDFDSNKEFMKEKVIITARLNTLEDGKPQKNEVEAYNEYLAARMVIYDEVLDVINKIYPS